MKTIDIVKTTGQLREYAQNARNEAIIVTRRGKPMAAVIGVDQFDYESLSLSTNPKFIGIITKSRARLEKEGGLSSAEVRRKLGMPLSRKKRHAKLS